MADTETKPDPSKAAETAFYAIEILADNPEDARRRWERFEAHLSALTASWTEPADDGT